MNIVSLIASDNFIVVNKMVAKELGINTALLLGELASQYQYYARNDMLDEDGYFYATNKDIEEETTLTIKQQKSATDRLEMMGVLNTKVCGMPAKKWFKFNIKALEVQLGRNCLTSSAKTAEQVRQNLPNINNNIYNSIVCIDNPTSKPSPIENLSSYSTAKSTEEEAKSNREATSSLENPKGKKLAEEVIGYLNERLGKGKFRVVAPAVKLITGRAKEGATFEDFKAVIDKKYAEWWNNGDMRKFIRPATLFAPSHFWDYLGELESHPSGSAGKPKNPNETVLKNERDVDIAGLFK